ncbi:hypothetical protein SASPL_130342 [Salvia splendens]|uniref:Photosystem II 10 kDa polypeptide, chloroplastic n=1 Tax=Salvia splendens TaxID=180675 RepID=A0A8X8ZJX8_SALSN|nr:hypothetical protein SASPL_130342 [Salvia splendens]
MSSASFAAVRGLPSLARTATPFRVQASGGKKIKTDTPYGTGGGMDLRNGIDASGLSMTGMIGPQVTMSTSEAPPAWPYGWSPSSASLPAARFLSTTPVLWRSKLELPPCFSLL